MALSLEGCMRMKSTASRLCELLEWFQQDHGLDRLRGTLSIIHVINTSGFEHMQRRVFEQISLTKVRSRD